MEKEDVKQELYLLDATVYPSDFQSIHADASDGYDGAHRYEVNCSLGFKDGETIYTDTKVSIDFVEKLEDGTVWEGLQSEQLAIILKDRAIKLGKRYPHEWTDKMVAGLDMFLDACRERVESRIGRNVMGELKK